MQQRRRSGIILGLVALGLLAGAALTAPPAPAVVADGPYYALPSWDRKLGCLTSVPDNCPRFVVLMNWSSAAVLDKETGLVWERTPAAFSNNFSWVSARNHCASLTAGNHKGWRLPSVHELASLIDPAHTGILALPPGHPFDIAPIVNVHWTATTNAVTDTRAWSVNFITGAVTDTVNKVGNPGNAWCVRGGMNADHH